MSAPLLEVRMLCLRFGGLTALDQVSFQVQEGEIVSVIGPNGAGKTSLFNAITGLHPPTSGAVLVGGTALVRRFGPWDAGRWLLTGLVTATLGAVSFDVLALWDRMVTQHYLYQQAFPWAAALASGVDELRHSELAITGAAIGFLIGTLGAVSSWFRGRRCPELAVRAGLARTFQNIRLFQQLSALDNVLLGMDGHLRADALWAALGIPLARRQVRQAAADALALLELVGLGELAQAPAGTLSYGHQRRLEIARALAARPRLLLLDEPAAGMNPSEAESLIGLIRSIRARGIAILLIEHHMRVVMNISDRIVVLHYGHRIAEGTPQVVREDRQVIEAYLGGGAA
jgi:branched-chain amino acid transport system ATP-binding protein